MELMTGSDRPRADYLLQHIGFLIQKVKNCQNTCQYTIRQGKLGDNYRYDTWLEDYLEAKQC